MTAETWPAEWLPARRRETAWHESGHALAAVLLGLPVEHVSIVRTSETLGHARFVHASPDDHGRSGICTLDQPSTLRDWAERAIIYSLAGPIAGLFSGPMEPGRSDDFDEREALAIARRSDRIRELTAALEADPGQSDDENAPNLSGFLTGSAAMQHVAWLTAETRALLERHAAALVALAGALYEAVEMTGPEIEAVIRANPCTCHPRQAVAP
jgi:hypothetical protein